MNLSKTNDAPAADDLRAGVQAGILTEAQAASLTALIQSRAGQRAAMPSEDEEVKGLFARYHLQFKQPLQLSDVVERGLDDYIAIFIPGGHGALIGLPESRDVAAVLVWAAAKARFVISLCHGPAAFLAVGDSDIYRGYKICAFPDALDAQTPDIGYMPGHLTWQFGEKLKALGFDIVNDDISGAVHRDRKLLTGDSPLAGNALGQLAASALLEEVSAG